MNKLKPYLAASFVVCAWSGWITLSRYGVQSQLEPADITLLRYITALIVLLPLLLRHQWNKFSLKQYLVVGLGVGFPYTLLSFYGLRQIHAAYAGVLVNGMLPIFSALLSWLLFRQGISPLRYLAIGLIFFANLAMAKGNNIAGEHGLGICMLLMAALCYTFHMIGIRLYKFQWRDVLVTVPLVNCILFIPLWFFMPSTLSTAPLTEIVVQSLYQGVLVNIFALMCGAYAIHHLGVITVSIFNSFVPVLTAVLAWIFLQESLTSWEITGISICSLGLLLYAGAADISRIRSKRPTDYAS